MQKQVVVWKSSNGAAVSRIAHEHAHDLRTAAMLAVPPGQPYIVVDDGSLPDVPQHLWDIDLSEPDGYGCESHAVHACADVERDLAQHEATLAECEQRLQQLRSTLESQFRQAEADLVAARADEADAQAQLAAVESEEYAAPADAAELPTDEPDERAAWSRDHEFRLTSAADRLKRAEQLRTQLELAVAHLQTPGTEEVQLSELCTASRAACAELQSRARSLREALDKQHDHGAAA